jgi:hypothetical protein
MRMTKEELAARLAQLPHHVLVEILAGVGWDAYGDLDEEEVEYIDSGRRPSSEDCRTACEYYHAEVFMRDHPEPTVAEVLRAGELDIKPGHTFVDIIEMAGECLDANSSWEICGNVLFKGSDGRFYSGNVEFEIGEASAEYVKSELAALADEEEEEGDEDGPAT